MVDLLKSGGVILILIILGGIVATYIIIERLIFFASVKKRDAAFKANLKDALAENDFSAADAFCIAAGTPFSKVVRKALRAMNLEDKYLEDIVTTELESVIPQIEHSLTLLGTIANISTLLGLLGTVTGNIKAFGVLGGGASMGNPAVLAGSISEALVTTAAGLCVAIPAMIASNFFNRKVNKEIISMEAETTELLLKLKGKIKK